MRVAIIVLVFLCILPYVFTCISAYYRRKQLGTINNENPRAQYTQLEGPGARAVAAQQNAWEALIIYSAALLAVVAARVDVPAIGLAAIIVLVARILHGFFYLANLDKLRTLSFLVAIVACFYLFFVALANLFMR